MVTPEQFFRALSDTTRLNSLLLLQQEGRLCVCELVAALDLSQPRVSRHLSQLRDQGIVQDERRGQWVHYRLAPELPEWAYETLRSVLVSRDLSEHRRRLVAMGQRPSVDAAE
ncbi:metalloregulator ArsR/SmtB family transcription factor [Salicola sp. Rm-C-2C1-2]|uniref:metalloregulator ArsR/SmtB family transcription factor n=1 Tax=Salicola sp. Rm-C-2C1-2 TaxID=3141321 RepID=UPI0032E42617